jgi:predicted metal-dependent HD superfamily phosphohydrolase
MFSIIAGLQAGLRHRYAEPHRAYHGQSHIDAMLCGLDRETAHVTQHAAAELAVWYHDAIYDPAATDNEGRSATLLRREMAGLADAAVIDAAGLMILATADHLVPSDLPDALRHDVETILDLDMAVLGATPDEYDAYESGIAAEYTPVHGADAFRRGRAGFLQGLLGRPRLFHTDRFHAALDRPARENLQRALGALAARD